MARSIDGSFSGGLFLCFFAATTLFAAPTNLLVNPGFETGDFNGWTVGGNSPAFGIATDGTPITGTDPFFGPTFVNVRSGNFAAWAIVQHFPLGVPAAKRLLLSQDVVVPPNTSLDVGFWLGNDSQATYAAQYENGSLQIFIDGAFILSNGGPTVPPSSDPTGFVEIKGSFNTGQRTSVNVQFAINGSGTALAGASFDDFFVTAPEPSALGLMAIGTLGCIGLLAAKRRAARSA